MLTKPAGRLVVQSHCGKSGSYVGAAPGIWKPNGAAEGFSGVKFEITVAMQAGTLLAVLQLGAAGTAAWAKSGLTCNIFPVPKLKAGELTVWLEKAAALHRKY